MVARVLIIGGYGNFGSYIARSLGGDANIRLLIGGRSAAKASGFVNGLDAVNAAEAHEIDIARDVRSALARIEPDIVIHTTGPFQSQDHGVARACIAQGCHYLDLADARDFVATIGELDAEAQAQDVLVVSGASSVPCLTAAIIDHYQPRFSRLETVDYGISAAQQTNRGLATASAILSYVGKPFPALRGGKAKTVHGWQDLHAERYPELGRRLFGDCDIPDLSLFPARYPTLRTLRFGAGHEIKLLHLGTWLLSWAVRAGLVRSLGKHAETLLRLSFLFDPLGSSRSGFHMYMIGDGKDGRALEERFFMVARSGHGPYIPCMPSILLARRLAQGALDVRGAMPCVDLITLEDYLAALDGLDISIVRGDAAMTGADRPPLPDFDMSKPLFVFDGVCVLCSGGARFLMRHDGRDRIRFTPAQSPLGRALYAHFGLDFDETYLLVDQGRAYAKTSGYLRLCAILGGGWRVLRIGAIVPKRLRDAAYDLVARNRYRWFGKTGYCALLTEEQRNKLL